MLRILNLAVALCALSAAASAQTILNYGAACDGATDDSAAFAMQLAAGANTAVVPYSPRGCVAGNVTVGSGQTVTGLPGALVIAKTEARQAFLIKGNFGTVKNLHIAVNGAMYGVLAQGQLIGPAVRSNHFTGGNTRGAYILWQGDSAGATQTMQSAMSEDNIFDDTTLPLSNQAEVFESVIGFVASRNKCLYWNGFCEQARWSKGVIDDLVAFSPNFGSCQTAVSGQTRWTFTTATTTPRYAVQIAGVPTSLGVITAPNGSDTSFSITTPAQTIGTQVCLVAFRSLEAINVNSGSQVTINGADIDGTGDGGIVAVADYHFQSGVWCSVGVGSCGTPVYADFPYNLVVNHPTIRNTFGGAIEDLARCSSMTVGDGYVITNFGLGASDPVFPSGIITTYADNPGASVGCVTRIGSGIIDNSGGYGKYGVLVNGTGQIEDGGFEKMITVAPIAFRGSFVEKHNFSANLSLDDNMALMSGITFSGRTANLFPAQPDWDTSLTGGKPVDSTYWTYALMSSGWTNSSCPKRGGNNCVMTIAGSEVQMIPRPESNTTSLIAGKLLRFTFWAKGSGACDIGSTCSYVSVVAAASGGRHPHVTLSIASPDWRQYEVDVPLQNVTGLHDIRIGCPRGGVPASFQYPELSMMDID